MIESATPAVVLLLALVFVLSVLLLRQSLHTREAAERLFDRWRDSEMLEARAELAHALEREASTSLDRWKLEHEMFIRKDALKRSQSSLAGKATEHLVPYLPGFPFDPKDVRFLGAPVDLVVFDGLSEGELREVVFVEVKTGSSAALSTRERRIRDAVVEGRVRFLELRVPVSEGSP